MIIINHICVDWSVTYCSSWSIDIFSNTMENFELCSGIKIKCLMIYSKGLLSFVGEGIFLEMDIFTTRKRSLGQGNIFRSVCQEFCPQGRVCLSACWDIPPEQKPPLGAETPPGAEPLPKRSPPSPGADPPGADPAPAQHAGRYGQRAGGTHPTGMQSCYPLLWSCGKIIVLGHN